MKYLIRTLLIGAACIAAPLSALWADETNQTVPTTYRSMVLTCLGHSVQDHLNILHDGYGESVIFEGVNERQVAFVTVSEESGTWTIFFVGADGVICTLLAGELFLETATNDLIKKGDPT